MFDVSKILKKLGTLITIYCNVVKQKRGIESAQCSDFACVTQDQHQRGSLSSSAEKNRLVVFVTAAVMAIPVHSTICRYIVHNILIPNILQEISTLEYFTPDHSFQFGKRKQNTIPPFSNIWLSNK